MNSRKYSANNRSELPISNLRILSAFLIFLVSIASCGKDNTTDIQPPMATTAHFPLEIGKYIDYQIQEYIYSNDGARIDTQIYQMRDHVVDQVSLTNRDAFIVDQYIRVSANDDWQLDRSITASIDDNEAIRQEDNFQFVKLLLPIENDLSWNGNKYFDSSAEIMVGSEPMDYFKNWESKYLEVKGTSEIGLLNFDNVLTVQLADSENRLELRYGQEKYAEGIGLISRELRILDTQCFDNCASVPWEEKANKGIIYIQTVIDYN